jgi:hypothetical protein
MANGEQFQNPTTRLEAYYTEAPKTGEKIIFFLHPGGRLFQPFTGGSQEAMKQMVAANTEGRLMTSQREEFTPEM